MRYPDWMRRAECLQSDPEQWFPHDGNERQAEWAIKICRMCPVQIECLEHTLRCEEDAPTRMRFGIFGGLTPEQRHKLAAGRAA